MAQVTVAVGVAQPSFVRLVLQHTESVVVVAVKIDSEFVGDEFAVPETAIIW